MNIILATELGSKFGLKVIVSGGVHSSDDVFGARDAKLAGVIVGRALYEGHVDLGSLISDSEV